MIVKIYKYKSYFPKYVCFFSENSENHKRPICTTFRNSVICNYKWLIGPTEIIDCNNNLLPLLGICRKMAAIPHCRFVTCVKWIMIPTWPFVTWVKWTMIPLLLYVERSSQLESSRFWISILLLSIEIDPSAVKFWVVQKHGACFYICREKTERL